MKSHGDHITHARHELERQHSDSSHHEHGTYKPKYHAGVGMAGHKGEEARVDHEVKGKASGGMHKHDGEPKSRHQDESGISEGEQKGTMKHLARMP